MSYRRLPARAVSYVKDLLTGLTGFHITLVTIIPEPSEDYFISGNERTEWIRNKNVSAGNIPDKFRKAFIEAGVRDEDVNLSIVMKECTSIAECILCERDRFVCGTVVIGRRGISKKEEFLFGSTSSKILHSARDCAVWVIE